MARKVLPSSLVKLSSLNFFLLLGVEEGNPLHQWYRRVLRGCGYDKCSVAFNGCEGQGEGQAHASLCPSLVSVIHLFAFRLTTTEPRPHLL